MNNSGSHTKNEKRGLQGLTPGPDIEANMKISDGKGVETFTLPKPQ